MAMKLTLPRFAHLSASSNHTSGAVPLGKKGEGSHMGWMMCARGGTRFNLYHKTTVVGGVRITQHRSSKSSSSRGIVVGTKKQTEMRTLLMKKPLCCRTHVPFSPLVGDKWLWDGQLGR